MPIYMDRHYIEGATRLAIRDAHEKDLEIQGRFGVEFITYWFDEEKSIAFCLVDAPDKASIVRVHGEAHGEIPHEIIEVDPLVVESFLGRIKDPVPTPSQEAAREVEIDCAFRTIMFTDLKDSTATTTRLGDSKAMHLLRIHNAFTRNALRENGGREVKHTGDGFMVSFADSSSAVRCAINIQNAFASYNEEDPGESLHVRIGLSAGEPVEEDGDLFGTTVQLAARLCDHAKPDGILVSSSVKDTCGVQQFAFQDLGDVMPKGFKESVQLYEVSWRS